MSPNDLIEKFYKTTRDKYPNLTLEQYKEICKSPFNLIKETMKEGKLEDIRLQYFGVFKVFPARVKGMKNIITTRLRMGKMSKPEFDGVNDMLTSYIGENSKKFKDESKIKC